MSAIRAERVLTLDIGAAPHIGIFTSDTLQAFNQTPWHFSWLHAAQCIAPYGPVGETNWIVTCTYAHGVKVEYFAQVA